MRRAAFLLAAAVLAAGCRHGGEADLATLSSNSDQIIWEAGQKAYQKKQWEAARQHFKRIIDGFPQSEYGPSARLAAGDSYVAEGDAASLILAIADYRDFLTLYPSHPRSDYAQFQLAECYFRQRNGPDRDQTSTEKALAEFQKLLEFHPSSSHVEAARQRIVACRQSLARAEFLAGYFYQKTRRAYRAAISRYEILLEEYPDFENLDEVLLRLAEALAASGRPAEALPRLARLLEAYPSSNFVGRAQKLKEEVSLLTAAPPAAATPSPGSPSSPAPPATPSPAPTPTPGS